MINVDEYLRFRRIENKFVGIEPKRREYKGVKVVRLNMHGPNEPVAKFDYGFHPLFGTIVIYREDVIGKTPICEDIDAEIIAESKMVDNEWLNEDELPEGYPYDEMFPYSKLGEGGKGGVRIFPKVKTSCLEKF